MDFVSNKKTQIEEMLKVLGLSSVDELLTSIPVEILQKAPPFDDGLSELEGALLLEKIGKKNTYLRFESYLGGGAYDHYTPAIVQAITSRSEFLTTYTPYQAESSQGSLQAIFEFQSMIAAITQMEVSNASLYDGASAAAEAVLMAKRLSPSKTKVYLASTIHPYTIDTIKMYAKGHGITFKILPMNEKGGIDLKKIDFSTSDEPLALIVQSPNFFGVLEDLEHLGEKIKNSHGLLITIGNPLSYALFHPPHHYDADIAVGDVQPLGLPLQFGGPFAGYIATKEKFIRELPGRLVGETVDIHGKRGFCLTLQPREQHIRREKATSNICSNQALAALSALITSLWYGPIGLRKLALTNFQRASYLKENLSKIKGFSSFDLGFNEFTLHLPISSENAINHFKKENILPGIPLSSFYPDMKNSLLVAVTELKSEEALNRYIEVAKTL